VAVSKQKPLLFVMEVMWRVNLRFLVPFLASILVGCGSSTNHQEVPCPHTAIVGELSKRVDASGVRTDIDSVRPVCQWVDHRLYMDMRLRMTSFRETSKHNTSLTIAPVYVVAILNEKGNLLSRTLHQAEITFEPEEDTVVSFQQLQVMLASEDCSVYVGFDLDEKQLRALEKERGSGCARP